MYSSTAFISVKRSLPPIAKRDLALGKRVNRNFTAEDAGLLGCFVALVHGAQKNRFRGENSNDGQYRSETLEYGTKDEHLRIEVSGQRSIS